MRGPVMDDRAPRQDEPGFVPGFFFS